MPLWDSLRSCGEFGGGCGVFCFFSLIFFTFFLGGESGWLEVSTKEKLDGNLGFGERVGNLGGW